LTGILPNERVTSLKIRLNQNGELNSWEKLKLVFTEANQDMGKINFESNNFPQEHKQVFAVISSKNKYQ